MKESREEAQFQSIERVEVESAQHFIITRFHVGVTRRLADGSITQDLASEKWLRHRLTYFERYCVPSIERQTRRDFEWILLYDAQSPDWVSEYLSQIESANAHPVELGQSWPDVASAVQAIATSPVVITTRFDSDDALAYSFVERLREVGIRDLPSAINFMNGLRVTKSGLLKARHMSNPFASLVEDRRKGTLQTIHSGSHDDLHLSYPIVQVAGDAAWMQSIHDRNLANVAAGLPVRAARFRNEFPGLEEIKTWNPKTYVSVARPHSVVKRRLQMALRRNGK